MDRALAKIEEILLALLLIGLVLLAAVQVLLRNVWGGSIDWAEVTLQNATVLLGLLGAAVATSESRHLNIDLLGRSLQGRGRQALAVLIGIFAVGVTWYLTKGGWQTYRANYEPWLANVPKGWTASKMLIDELAEGSFPQWLSQLALPIGFALIGVHFCLRLVRDVLLLITGKSANDGEEELDGDAYLDHMLTYADGAGSDDAATTASTEGSER